ncbi:MAG TPA: hypothetical protein VE553_07290, partial [Candidatus Binatia bacterium]|nr:hypothetical protein [Candidatus Binatia bacterium]
QERYPQIAVKMLRYYYFCGWTIQVLAEFEQMLVQSNTNCSCPIVHALPAVVSQLQQILRTELSRIELEETVDNPTATELRTAIALLAARLGSAWRYAVYASARPLC